MIINTDDIFKFYEKRIECHIKSVNYFASLLGHNFPDHDRDKVKEPIRTGYAYIFYNNYHPQLNLMNEYFDLCKDAHDTHHKHATHHIEHYDNVQNIPDVSLYEMFADWNSANFEQINILHEPDAILLDEWFDKNMSKLPWSDYQLEIIKKSFETIKEKTDKEIVESIWQELLSLV